MGFNSVFKGLMVAVSKFTWQCHKQWTQNKPLKSYVLKQHHATNPYRSGHTQTSLVSFMPTALIMVTEPPILLSLTALMTATEPPVFLHSVCLTIATYFVLLTVHLITVFVNNQLDAQFFSLYLFIPILYMFRATKCSSSGESIVSVWPGAAFEGGKWGDRPRPRSWGGPALQAYEFVKLYSPVNWKCWYMLHFKSFFKVKFCSVVLGCLLYRNRHNQCVR